MFSKGYGSGRNKIIAHLSGGYWCMGRDRDEVLSECVQRTTGRYGGTDWYPEFNSQPEWFYFSKCKNNELFYNWNRIYLLYCDGSGHQGYTKDLVEYDGT